MSYIIQNDFKRLIQADNLTQIIGNDTSVLDAACASATTEALSFLVAKYDVMSEFRALLLWNNASTYKAGDRVYDDAKNYYYVSYPAPVFDFDAAYKSGDIVFWKDSVYTCQQATELMTHAAALQYGSYDALPISNVAPDDRSRGFGRWSSPTAYTTNAPLTDTTKWTKGDNRNQQLVNYVIDIALYTIHSRIAPRNTPDIRVKRYDDAITWLRRVSRGEEITAALPRKQQPTQTSNRIRFGGNIKNQNSY